MQIYSKILRASATLPLSATPVFPDRCVVCDTDHPSHHARLVCVALNYSTALHPWHILHAKTVHAPACVKCAHRLHSRRWITTISLLCIAGLLWVAISSMFKTFAPGLTSVFITLPIGAVCMLPFFFLFDYFPPRFDFDITDDGVRYLFVDEEFGINFAELNDHS